MRSWPDSTARSQANWGMTSNRIRVLYFINGLGTGGAERSLADLLRPLASRGIDLTMACLYERSEGVQGQITPSFDVRLLRERLWQRYRDARRLSPRMSSTPRSSSRTS